MEIGPCPKYAWEDSDLIPKNAPRIYPERITEYTWEDRGSTVRIVLQKPTEYTCCSDLIWDTCSLSMQINTKTRNLNFAVNSLANTISAVTLQERPHKLYLTLEKVEQIPWDRLVEIRRTRHESDDDTESSRSLVDTNPSEDGTGSTVDTIPSEDETESNREIDIGSED